MKLGDVINGYRIVTEPTNAGGGKCMWAFAERDGQEYFVKRFLDPKRPKPSSGPPNRSARIRLQACEEFEARHRHIMKALQPDQAGGGNLVLAQDFFCESSTYYKVTERIDTSNMDSPHTLGAREKSILLKTLGQSLRQLHDIDVVHGDLKPDNVLVQKQTVFHTAKLIDFDDAHLSGNPPAYEEVAGDALYGSPEWQRYVRGEEGTGPQMLTTASDVFALGLLTHLYLTGALPTFPDSYGSPADAVNDGVALEFDPRLAPGMGVLISRMCSAVPGARPGAGAFVNALNPSTCELRTRTDERRTARSEPGPEPSGGRSRLRTNLAGSEPSAGSGGDPRRRPDAERRSRVRINWS
ncbi:protein kinase domain-containing protein [Nocardiopsis dassonvillei]|uniref:Serine/threonine protein kinase n=1 Tax=Nocardiopsis dassonvillei (strain ATCC 23218 / DSM 43111 / CIP 107115 / JCM 7437 / KCTC 9190 / NBRC 14626 / NCTC 10488 / NRRL B-5397 / IMRU 509) TaxID=446468 RepID=D7AYY9_NOCDD|nr:lipopolysaccharide kinase InaA family protein [Nocardiopsis dassonvillei]ADH68151.1 serine/threonine protein kinase [Nocardiopsis dassonvillei subsp. dassonvillei DSM 43111]VEI88654.1 Serine/threonine-protein kinase D [Nocardiopsis dassonvillei]